MNATRENLHSIITQYDELEICVENYFRENNMMKEDQYIQAMEADPSHLECILSDLDVLHVSYDELEKLL